VRALLVLAVVVGALVAAPLAVAETVVRDDEGRQMTFDVRAAGVDVSWYANLLRRAAHGDEIEHVTIRIVPFEAMQTTCGASAGGCYRGRGQRGLIVVPAGKSPAIAHTLLHEYAHHVDASYDVPGVREPNGTPGWWEARGMARLLAEGKVSRTYSQGWQRAIGEIFAEDYVQLHLVTPYRIGWLRPPGRPVEQALRADIPGFPATRLDLPRAPVVVVRQGTLAAAQRRAVPFRLLGPGRRVTFTASLSGTRGGTPRGRLEIRCGGRVIAARALAGRQARRLDVRNAGPASCNAVVVSASRAPIRYSATLRLTVDAAARSTARLGFRA
jgi:hypothetical protein